MWMIVNIIFNYYYSFIVITLLLVSHIEINFTLNIKSAFKQLPGNMKIIIAVSKYVDTIY